MQDLTNSIPGFLYRYTNNNEEIRYYPKENIMQHTYEGFPAQGIIRYDVCSWEIVDSNVPNEQIEVFEEEINEYVEQIISGEVSDVTVKREEMHEYTFQEPYESEEYTVRFETENKRRIE